MSTFEDGTINKLVWLLDNMYIPGKQADRERFLDKIDCFDDLLLGVSGFEGMTIKKSMDYLYNQGIQVKGTDAEITDLDIEVAQQLAIWHLTNPELFKNPAGEDTGIPTVYLSKYGETAWGGLNTYTQTFQNQMGTDANSKMPKEGTLREYYVKMIYKYFVDKEAANVNYNISADPTTVISVYSNSGAQPIVTVEREKDLKGEYDIVIKKVSEENKTPLQGAEFTVNGIPGYITGEDGKVNITRRTNNRAKSRIPRLIHNSRKSGTSRIYKI